VTRPSRGLRRAAIALLLGTLVTCTPPEPSTGVAPDTGPGPETTIRSPDIRIGLLVGVPKVDVSGDSGLVISDGGNAMLGEVPRGLSWSVGLEGGQLGGGSVGAPRITGQSTFQLRSVHPSGVLTVNGRRYHGSLTVVRDRSGITAINVVPIEEYLGGVVAAEMGRRDSSEAEALAAQAVVSRTFAIRNLGKRAAQGFDLYATVADQVYGGITSEYPLAVDAVRRTGGMVLTYDGVPIDAFFFSTCGGRTADGTEVFAAADRPYLRSIHDTDANGQAWCRNSPRFRWREEWSGEQLRAVMRVSLPPAAPGTSAEAAGTASGVSITGRTSSDRVARIAIRLLRGSVEVNGPAVRQVLRPSGQSLLRSASFDLHETREGGKLTRLVVEGRGSGHGVGYCQWGAIGRSRAGQDARTILSAYFQGTTLSRAY
jgi:stage II sporulation protein D